MGGSILNGLVGGSVLDGFLGGSVLCVIGDRVCSGVCTGCVGGRFCMNGSLGGLY